MREERSTMSSRGKTVGRRLGAVERGQFYARRIAGLVLPAACVLTYHRVAETGHDPFGQAVAPSKFERQLGLLRSSYPLERLDVVLERVAGGRLEHGTVAVTFDDGYADTLTAAAPIAAAAGVPLHVFVTAGALGSPSFWWDRLAAACRRNDTPGAEAPNARLDELHSRLKQMPAAEREAELDELGPAEVPADFGKPLTLEEFRELAGFPGVGIGSHTISHPSLGRLLGSDQQRELVESRTLLEDVVGAPVKLLSYPFGKTPDVASETRELAREAGYSAAFTSVPLALTRRSSLLALPRLTVHDWPDVVLAGRLRRLFGY
jgi:peptidoglycan/xylan/chitin deacetylase (PgdA/CDA1 family)